MVLRSAALCVAMLASGVPVVAGQAPAAQPGGHGNRPASPSKPAPATLTVGWEFRDDTYRYRFENPSSFDSPELVPHFFEQDYDARNQWLTARARYELGGRRLESEVAVALRGVGQGADYDTFFQPSGDVVVYGTSAVTDVGAFRFTQRVEIGTLFGFVGRVGYAYRRDRAEFRPSDSVTRHSMPPSETRFFNTDREATVSAVHEAQFGVIRAAGRPGRWQLVAGLDLTPVTLARLTTVLPDKYPGQDIVFIAKGLSLTPSLRLTVTRGKLALGFSADYARTWPYQSGSRFTRNWFGLVAFAGWSAP